MPKLKPISGKKLIKIFSEFDFSIERQKGSHVIISRKISNTKEILVIPNHKELDAGTLYAIVKQASKYISQDELYKKLS